MKKIFKLSAIFALCAAVAGLSGCNSDQEFDPNPMGGDIAFLGMAPNPVMRGGALNIMGCNLDKVKEVQFAGDVTVTEFVDLKKGSRIDTLIVVVPLEGPVVGKVNIVTKDGITLTSLANLEFTEPIEIQSYSPATVLSGDVLTFKGEYLNDVKEIFFTGEDVYVTKFESQSRHELKVVVPATAITGPVILSDVNEVEDQNTIPNHIYTSTDLVVGKPTVTTAAKATYKSGDVITVNGAHLDMIKTVDLAGAADVQFTLAADAKSFTFNLPPSATDGHITLTSYAGDTFDAGEIETVTVTALAIKSLAEDKRFKAGCKVEITGEDLDLVTKVEFTGAEATWSRSEDKIEAIQPEAAKDGVITVTLASGKKAYTEEIEVVKPVVTGVDKTEAVAGKDKIVVSGTDLDLVTAVTIGDKAQSFIDCEFEFVTDEETSAVNVSVSIPGNAYTGVLTLTAASTYSTETDAITVTYDEAVSISFDKPSIGLGNEIAISGKNLMKIEQIYIKGKKVTSYSVRTDTAMSFGIPDGLGPGVYRLSLVLTDGTEMTWPIPFEITAPFTETFIWEGSEAINWTGMGALSWGGYDWSTVKEGTVLCVYFTLDDTADYWQLRIANGSWASLPSLAGLAPEGNLPLEPGMTEYKCELTAADLDVLVNQGGLVLTGANYTVTGVSLIVFGAAEKRTVIWEGSLSAGGWANALQALSWGGYDWSTVSAGTKLSVVYTIDDPDGCIRFGNGSWVSLPSLAGLATDGNLPLQDGGYTFELTDADLAVLVNDGGLVICGAGFTITEVALVTMEGAGPQEKTIWEGSVTAGAWASALQDLSWGGYDWSTVEAGTTLCAHYTIDDPEGCIRFGNGSWVSIPSLAGLATDGNLPLQEGGHEVELTQADIDELVANGGLVICGAGFTITEVGLK